MAYREFQSGAFSRRAMLRGGAILGAGAALSGVTGMHAAFAKQSGSEWTNIQAMVSRYVGSGKVANMVAALGWGQKDLQAVAEGTLTIGQAAPADLDSLYRIYSMTKPVTGMAAMMLIEDGKIGLDQPIADLLPKYANMQVQKTYDGSITDLEPAVRPITVRQLLTHTAGLGYGIVQQGPLKGAYEEAGVISGQVTKLPIRKLFGRGTPPSSLAQFADALADMPLVYQPGSKWSYSVSLDLLGRVIEVASGVPFDVFLRDNIFKPAGMNSTWFQVPQSETSRLTSNYFVMNGALIPLDPAGSSIFSEKPPFPMGGSGLVSSPRDYDRFLRMLLGYGVIDGKRVMGELAVRVGTSNILPDGAISDGTLIQNQGFGAGGRVGLGEERGTFGWGGAAGTVALVDLRRGLRASLFTQFMRSDAYPVHSEFPAAVLADLKASAN